MHSEKDEAAEGCDKNLVKKQPLFLMAHHIIVSASESFADCRMFFSLFVYNHKMINIIHNRIRHIWVKTIAKIIMMIILAARRWRQDNPDDRLIVVKFVQQLQQWALK